MGNHLCPAQPCISTVAAKVIRWDNGAIEEFREAVKVGELMVDNPQQFVCDFSDLQAGRRITALRPEEDLELGGVYVLLPMHKYLRSVLSSSESASINLLALKCNSAGRKLPCNSRIFPAVCTGNLSDFSLMNDSAERAEELQAKVADRFEVPKLELDEDEDRPTELGIGLRQHRIGGFRVWKPELETIKESPRVDKHCSSTLYLKLELEASGRMFEFPRYTYLT